MEEIKQIIKGRVKDILDLEETSEKQDQRQNLIIKQRNMEIHRNCQQLKLLAYLDNHIGSSEQMFEKILPSIEDICTTYDPTFKSEQGKTPIEKLYKMLRLFFINEDQRQKVLAIKSALAKPNCAIPPSMIFSWLSEWSRKKYLQILDMQIKSKNKVSKVFIHETYADDTNFNSDLNFNGRCLSKQSNKYLEHGSLIRRSLCEQEINSSIKLFSTHKKIQISSDLSLETNRFRTISQSQPTPNPKHLTIYNKPTLYGYIHDELSEYYRLTQIVGLDKNYMKSIRKKKLKEHFMTKQNQKKVAEVLIQCSGNKEIKNILKEYENNYKIYKEQQKIGRETVNNHNISQSVNTNINESQISTERQKKLNLHLPIKGIRYEKQTADEIRLSNQTEPNDISRLVKSSNEHSNPHQNNHKSNIIQSNDQAIKMKFPNIGKSFEKPKPTNEEKTKLIRSYQIKQKQVTKSNQTVMQTLSNFPKFKFNQRQTIKGIIIKNFLSNRNKIGKNLQEQLQSDEKNELLYIKNNKKTKISADKMFKVQQITQSTDIRSLKQKTNAILGNFKAYQNF